MQTQSSSVMWGTEEPSAAYSTPPGRMPPLLARIPDLSDDDAADAAIDELPAGNHGRLISQSLANKLVLGGGIVLVLAAILPFVSSNRGGPKPSEPAPSAWQPRAGESGMPAWSSETAKRSPSDTSAKGPAIVVPAAGTAAPPLMVRESPSPTIASRAAVAEKAPMAPSPIMPASETPRVAARPIAGPTAADNGLPPGEQAASNQPMSLRAPNGPAPGPTLGPAAAAPVAPAAASRSWSELPDYRRGEMPPAPQYQADARADFRQNHREAPATPAPRQPSDAPAGAAAGQAPQGMQPGVAEFQGTIEKPPIGTYYDRSGSSIH